MIKFESKFLGNCTGLLKIAFETRRKRESLNSNSRNRGEQFNYTHYKTLSVVAMCVCNDA